MNITTTILDEEKSLINEYPPELSQEPYLIVGLIGNEYLPQGIKQNLFKEEGNNGERKIVPYVTKKEYLPLRKQQKRDDIYEFLQPDQTFVRAEWLNKVRHNTPSVIVMFETSETLFSPDHDVVPQIELIRNDLLTRQIKLVIVIITHSPQVIVTSDSFNSFRKRTELDGIYFFNLSDIKNSMISLTNIIKELSKQHYNEIESILKNKAQITKLPWKAAISYFKAAFISEVKENKNENIKISIKLYSKAYDSAVELLKVEEQRFYKSSNVLATKEFISWIMFRMFHLFEKLNQFKEMVEFFNKFIKTCLKYIGIDEFLSTHYYWIAKQYQLLASIYERNKINENDSIYYSFSSSVYMSQAYYTNKKLYSSNLIPEFSKYLPSKCNPEYLFDYALKQHFYTLFKIHDSLKHKKILIYITKKITLLLLNKPSLKDNRIQWWNDVTILKVFNEIKIPQNALYYFIDSLFSLFDQWKKFDQTLPFELKDENTNNTFIIDILNTLNQTDIPLKKHIIKTPLLSCFVSFATPCCIIGESTSINLDIISRLPSLPLYRIELLCDDINYSINLPSHSVKLPQKLNGNLKISIPFIPKRIGDVNIQQINIYLSDKKPLLITKTENELKNSKDSILKFFEIQRIIPDFKPLTHLHVIQRNPSIKLSIETVTPAIVGEKLPIIIEILNEEHYTLTNVMLSTKNDDVVLTSDTHLDEPKKVISFPNIGVNQKTNNTSYLQFSKTGKISVVIIIHYSGINKVMSIDKEVIFDVHKPFNHRYEFISKEGSPDILHFSLNNKCKIPLVIDKVLAPTVLPMTIHPTILDTHYPCEFCCIPPHVSTINITIFWHRLHLFNEEIIEGITSFDIRKITENYEQQIPSTNQINLLETIEKNYSQPPVIQFH
ncbi:hypothetical protein EDI_202630 [Entamoeba dispar SAW760]|uniref:Trafficking protein particle complex subunit 11 domain-containing protein n=1 Tax=Entamoeba dispar (strain ATCC PRA-260 / SAW760) TaxID=370354 RepID=B0ET88_ENTDS|nr:uncharacterized protein EDI_202630 [Entamoeba dispar SAW760]EDR22248.1 hypothetical protein EDI_202630 [Entamoeba dispar SAW760]|eukprot:EDR22248.1 hypothetical protein EDI_202630 [Entamoeba dispar SAW760]